MRRSAGLTLLWAAAACAALAAAAFLAAHHPLWPVAASAALALWFALNLRYPGLWLFVVPAALPVANLAPWTGWIVFEEFDLLVLGALAAGHARAAWKQPASPPSVHVPQAVFALCAVMLGLLGLHRGVSDAGGWSFGWFDGYVQPLNSLRILKPLAYALLAWPLVRERVLASGDVAVRRFGAGMLVGLAVVGLAAMWERSAYPGLLNFSAPYRTTALFWEMHVGGAAIDGYLVLSAPFAAWALRSARTPMQWTAAAALALLAGYVCLTTFARGVYGAIGLPLAVLGMWLWTQRPNARPLGARWVATIGAASMAMVFLVFGPQGAYEVIAFAMLALAAGLVVLQRAGWVTWRMAGGLMLAMALALEVLAVFGPDSFMRTRLHAADPDTRDRLLHWREGLGLLRSPGEWLWGLGLGRLPANYAREVPKAEFSGDARLFERPGGGPAVRISGPRTDKRLGGQYGLTQRVPTRAAYRLAMDVRVPEVAHVYVQVCERHLLYDGVCRSAFILLLPRDGSWRHIEVALRGLPLRRDPWRAPRRAAFTLSVTNPQGLAEIDNVVLRGPDGESLIANGDFADGLAHWLPGAQAYYRPWHIDNLYLEALIERGVAGLAFLGAVLALALRGVLGAPSPRAHAPFFAASLAGALLLGLVSSLLDVPRVAFLLGLLCAFSFELGRPRAFDVNTRPQ